ncbi:MAG: hypothetical protein FWH45_01850 [Methanomassiliicoccaceae archaeon]|nr:hypothetical protein [Methanomassiliicoccaceae archaeon]MCL2145907.1 hypothetical protein [Methanomassiliicoccaceae archaeon]
MKKQLLLIYSWAAAVEMAALMFFFLFAMPLITVLFMGAITAVAAAFGLALGYHIRHKGGYPVKEDEMSRDIQYKSAYYAFAVTLPQIIAAWFLIEIVERDTDIDVAGFAKMLMQLVTALLLMTYSISFLILNRRMQKDG